MICRKLRFTALSRWTRRVPPLDGCLGGRPAFERRQNVRRAGADLGRSHSQLSEAIEFRATSLYMLPVQRVASGRRASLMSANSPPLQN